MHHQNGSIFYILKLPFSKYLNIQHACFVVSFIRASFLVWLGHFLAMKKQGGMFALSIVMFSFLEVGNRVLFSSSLFKCWTCNLGLHALNQLFNMSDEWFNVIVQYQGSTHPDTYPKTSIQNHAPRICDFFQFGSASPQNLATWKCSDLRILDLWFPPPPYILMGRPMFHMFFFSGQLGALDR